MKKRNFRAEATLGCGAFTLVEMLVVVVLIALLAGVSGGIYLGTYKSMLVKKAARDFLLAAKYARILAIERQSRCSIELNTTKNEFAIVVNQINQETGQTEQVMLRDMYFKSPAKLTGDVKFEKIQIKPIDPEDVAEIGQPDGPQGIVFSPNGTAQSAVVQIGDGRNHATVSILAATGKAKLYFGQAEELESNVVDLDAQL